VEKMKQKTPALATRQLIFVAEAYICQIGPRPEGRGYSIPTFA
jgi:hypothetical protein